MHKLVPPLIGLAVSSFLVYRAAVNFPQPTADKPTKSTTTTSATVKKEQHSTESPQVSVIRCLKDMDDLLDTVHDRASFAAIKPKLLARARQQATLAAEHPHQGLTQLSREAGRQLQIAANRHTESLARAIEVVPEVEEFFSNDLAKILSSK